MSSNANDGAGSVFGLVMGGGGARAAYQVGFLRCLARRHPEFVPPIITGVSAGAINAAHLAAYQGPFEEAVEHLDQLWRTLTVEDVFRTDVRSLVWNAVRWMLQLASGGVAGPPQVRGLVDTEPLRRYLEKQLHAYDGKIPGIDTNLRRGRLRAVAISTSSYTTGQSVTWVQGKEIEEWERPHRRSRNTQLSVEHVMASAALPLVFPAVYLDDGWYGDGGVRLTAPLSPALHLGANRVLAISTRYPRTSAEAGTPSIEGYPPPAQVVGVLLNSIFLDMLDHDAVRLERLNGLVEKLPVEQRMGLKPVELLVLRPSVDLGRLANEYEPRLPRAFRFLTRGLGTKQTRSPDFLSLILFQPDYLSRLVEIGERDAEASSERIDAFIRGERVPVEEEIRAEF